MSSNAQRVCVTRSPCRRAVAGGDAERGDRGKRGGDGESASHRLLLIVVCSITTIVHGRDAAAPWEHPWTFGGDDRGESGDEAHPAPVATGLLERESEFERLERRSRRAAAGAGAVIALEGEAGIGKTALLDHAIGLRDAGDARAARARRRARARVRLRRRASALRGAARGGAARRSRALAGGRRGARGAGRVVGCARAGPSPDLGAVLHGLYWLTANLSIEQPLLVAIDDAHWADDASMAFLAYLARRVDELAVLIVYASRVGEGASEALPAVAEPRSLRRAAPAGAQRGATAQLVAQQLGAAARRLHARMPSRDGGNPFLLGELLRALDADGIAPDDTSTTRSRRSRRRSIARATLARLRRLGPAAGELAFAVAVLGASAELRHAAELAGLDLECCRRSRRRARHCGDPARGRPLEFIHPIVRTTIYAELAPGRRASSHKRAARLLDARRRRDAAIAPICWRQSPAATVGRRAPARCGTRRDASRRPPPPARIWSARMREPPPPPSGSRCCSRSAARSSSAGRHGAVGHLREVLDHATDAGSAIEAARTARRVRSRTAAGLPEAMRDRPRGARRAGGRGRRARGCASGRNRAHRAVRAELRQGRALERSPGTAGALTGRSHGERLILACLAFDAAHGAGSAAQTAELARRALAGGRLVDQHRPGSADPFLAVWGLIYADQLDEAERISPGARARAQARLGRRVRRRLGQPSHVLLRQGRLAEAEAEARACSRP